MHALDRASEVLSHFLLKRRPPQLYGWPAVAPDEPNVTKDFSTFIQLRKPFLMLLYSGVSNGHAPMTYQDE